LILPIILIVLLGLLNLGLAIRAHLQLAQEAQEAAQILVHHPEYADEFVVTIKGATGGTFTLTTSGGAGQTTAPIAYNASPATVQAALEGLSDVGSDNVQVTGPCACGIYAVTFTGTAAATGLTVSGTTLTPTGANATSISKIVDYIDNTLGSSYPVTDSRDPTAGGNQSQVRVTMGTALQSPGCTITSANNCLVMQDTVKIDYWFKVIFPMVGLLSVGPFQPGGYINIGATQSTIVATQPPSNVRVCVIWQKTPTTYNNCPDIIGSAITLGEHEIFWSPPLEGGRVSLGYCLTGWYPANAQINLRAATPICPPRVSVSGPPVTTQHYVDTTDFVADYGAYSGSGGVNYTSTSNPSNPSIYYSVTAQEINGMTSEASSLSNTAPSP
jgi:hypothetical protein